MSLRKILLSLFLVIVVAIAVAVLWSGVLIPKYTAKAVLLISTVEPSILSRPNEKVDWEEFEIFRNTQAKLICEPEVIWAALRNNKLRNLECIAREDAKHKAVDWLASQIHVTLPQNKSGIMEVSVTLSNPNEAAAIVNGIVEAYMDRVVLGDRQKRRDRYDSLQRFTADKEEEVRKLREQLKREEDVLGVGDDATSALRGQMAVNIFTEYQRQLQAMKFDRNAIESQLQAAREVQKQLMDEKPTELEVAALLNTMPVYRELYNRRMLNELQKHNAKTSADVAKDDKGVKILPASGNEQDKAAKVQSVPGNEQSESSDDELKAIDAKLDELHSHCVQMLLEAKRHEIEQEVSRLMARINIATDQIGAFQKEVESKARDAQSVGKTTVATQTIRANLDLTQRMLSETVNECERLKIDLQSPPRVSILGNQNAPAAVPENPD